MMEKITSGEVCVGAYKLGFSIEGEGIPALVIGSAAYYPRTFSSDLRKHLKMIFVDHRGFGKRDGSISDDKCSLAEIVSDIEEVRNYLGLKKFIIIGHSGHAFMALEYAKMFPQFVSHVVLIAVGPSYSSENALLAEQYFKDSTDPLRKQEFVKSISTLEEAINESPERRFITFCLKFGPRSWFDPKYDAAHLWNDVTVNMDVIDHVWGKVFREVDITLGLETLKAPVYLALGLHDYLVPPFFTWNAMRKSFNDLTLRIFERSSHTPQFEESELFNKDLLDWINVKSTRSQHGPTIDFPSH